MSIIFKHQVTNLKRIMKIRKPSLPNKHTIWLQIFWSYLLHFIRCMNQYEKKSISFQNSPRHQHSQKYFNGGYFVDLDSLNIKLIYTSKEPKQVIEKVSNIESSLTGVSETVKIKWRMVVVMKNRPMAWCRPVKGTQTQTAVCREGAASWTNFNQAPLHLLKWPYIWLMEPNMKRESC